MQPQRGFVWLPLLLVILGALVVSGGAYYVMHQNAAPSATIDQSSLVTSSSTPTITGTISGTLNFSIQVGGSQGLSTERGGITISNGRWSATFDSFGPGTYPVYVIDNKSGKLLTSATLTVKAKDCAVGVNCARVGDTSGASPSSLISVPGMSKYTDSGFGFSFWYPSGWTVSSGSSSNPNKYEGGTVSKVITLRGKVMISEANVIALPGDATAHVQDVVFTLEEFTSPTGVSVITDWSRKTMGGLSEYSKDRTTNDKTVLLSTQKALFVGESGVANQNINIQGWLTDTITATDPSVATPVSAAEQTATIQAEQKAYAGQ